MCQSDYQYPEDFRIVVVWITAIRFIRQTIDENPNPENSP